MIIKCLLFGIIISLMIKRKVIKILTQILILYQWQEKVLDLKEGYNSIKAMIQIENESMFIKTTRSFPKAKNWIFIFRDTPKLAYSNVLDALKENFKNNKILILKNETTGQAATCLEAKPFLDQKKSLFIASCDYISIYDQNKWEQMVKYDKDADVIVWTYKPNDIIVKNFNAFAYCKKRSHFGIGSRD